MNPYNNNFSYSNYSNYQNSNQPYNNNTNNNNYPFNNNQNQYQSNPYNQNNKNQNFLNPYNFPNTLKNNTNSYSNPQNQNIIYNSSSLKNNPISMYTNDYYKAKNLINQNDSNNNLNNDYNITYDNTKIETWGDFTKYWIFLHHHNYKEGIQNLLKLKKNFFVYMYGSHDSKGISWCSDCRYAEPNINLIKGIIASKENEKEIYFVNIPIDKEKKPSYKNDNILKLTHVPTLIYFENKNEIRRIIQNDMFDKKKVIDFIMKSYKRFY